MQTADRTQTATNVDIGLKQPDRQAIAAGLSRVLADSYTLYLKTQNFHWNVTGPMFKSLHDLFEEQYDELSDAVDDVAERIRALDYAAPGSFGEFLRMTSVEEAKEIPKASDMVRILVKDNEMVARNAHAVLEQADAAGDEPTVDLLTDRMKVHEENAWMLRSHLE